MMKLSQALVNLNKNVHTYNSNKKLFKNQISVLPYFDQSRLLKKDIEGLVHNFIESSECKQKIAKGQILYKAHDKAEYGYVILEGVIKLFSVKSDAERKEFLKENKRFTFQQKSSEICKVTKLERQFVTTQMISSFYYQQTSFCMLNEFHQMHSGDYFGFIEMLKLGTRPFQAICMENCTLLRVKRINFDIYFRQYELAKQNHIINMLSQNMDKIFLKELTTMYTYLSPYIIIKKCYLEEIIYAENELVTAVYMIIEGQFELIKNFELQIPYDHKKNQMKYIGSKNVDIRVKIILPGQFIGQEDIVINRNKRSHTLKCITESALVLKIESNYFLKFLNEKYDILKIVSKKAKEKIQLINEKYLENTNKIKNGFLKQFEIMEDKKRDIIVDKIARQDKTTNQQIEMLKQQPGIFYRDTFEKFYKLGMSSQGKQNFTRNIIKGKTKSCNKIQKNIFKNEQDEDKIVFSNKIRTNAGELMVNYLQNQKAKDQQSYQRHKIFLAAQREKNSRQNLKNKNKLVLDQDVLKIVRIKSGAYKRQLNKQVKPQKVGSIFDDKFSKVITTSITRRLSMNTDVNPAKLKEYIYSTYKNVVQNYKEINQYQTYQPPRTVSSYSLRTLKKNYQNSPTKSKHFSPNHIQMRAKSAVYGNENKKFDYQLAPTRQSPLIAKSSSVQPTSTINDIMANYLSSNNSRVVYLNHMMKPISYKL